MTLGLAAIAGGAFILGLSGALMPGPLFTVTLAQSARRGPAAGPLLITGHAILELALVAALLAGLGRYIKNPHVMAAVSLAGGLILAVMGAAAYRSAATATLEPAPGADTQRNSAAILSGALVTLSNPYWTLWWATAGIAYLAAARKAGVPGVAAFFIGHIASDFAWYSAVSAAAARGKDILPLKTYRTALRACAVFLIAFAAFFLKTAASYFAGNY